MLKARRIRLTFRRFGPAWLPLFASGCSTAPAQDIMGSFFPAWMLCACVGIVVAVAARVVLGAVQLNDLLLLPLLTYVAMIFAAALLTWLLWFGH